MQQFKIKQDGFKEIRKAILIKTIPIAILAAFVGLSSSFFNTSGQQSLISVLPILIPIIFGALAFGLYRGINRQKKIFESYVLTIDNHGIKREQHNSPTITISNLDIKEITKGSNGSFTIKGDSVNVIGIPYQIDEYEKLEAALSQIKQISSIANQSFPQKLLKLLPLLTLGLMAAVYISMNKIIVGASGTVLLSILGYSFFEIQRSKNVDNKTKKGTWWLILVTISILSIMYFKLIKQ